MSKTSKRLPKRTPWFPPEIKPVRSGFYDTKPDAPWNWWFSAKEGVWKTSKDGFVCLEQRRHWRGLTKEAK